MVLPASIHLAWKIGLALMLPVCLTGSVPVFELMTPMTPAERASFEAIVQYNRCLKPVIAARKRAGGVTISDAELGRLGYACPEELENVVRAMMLREDKDEKGLLRSRTREQREQDLRKDFASDAYCDFRQCPVL